MSKFWAKRNNKNFQRILTCILEGTTACINGTPFNWLAPNESPLYNKGIGQLQHKLSLSKPWSPIIPKVGVDLVSSPQT